MQFIYLLAALAAAYKVEATSVSTTITCDACHPASSTPDIVTRSDVPVSSCTDAPVLTPSYYSSSPSGPGGMPSGVPSGTGAVPTTPGAPAPTTAPIAGANSLAGGMVAAAAAAAMAAAYVV